MDPMVKKEFLKKMHEDILSNVKRCYTTNVAKVTFVAGLLGLGGLRQLQQNSFPGDVYYVVPLVAIFWDLIFFEQYFSLTRITTFIRANEREFEIESTWQQWIHEQNQVRKGFFFLHLGIVLTTVLSFVFSAYAAYNILPSYLTDDPNGYRLKFLVAYFVVLGFLYAWAFCSYQSKLDEVRKQEPTIKADNRNTEE